MKKEVFPWVNSKIFRKKATFLEGKRPSGMDFSRGNRAFPSEKIDFRGKNRKIFKQLAFFFGQTPRVGYTDVIRVIKSKPLMEEYKNGKSEKSD